eukprot:sb/3475516/
MVISPGLLLLSSLPVLLLGARNMFIVVPTSDPQPTTVSVKPGVSLEIAIGKGQPIITCYFGHVTDYQPIRDQYFNYYFAESRAAHSKFREKYHPALFIIFNTENVKIWVPFTIRSFGDGLGLSVRD